MEYLNSLYDTYDDFKRMMHHLFTDKELNLLTQDDIDDMKDLSNENDIIRTYVRLLIYHKIENEINIGNPLEINDLLSIMYILDTTDFIQSINYKINELDRQIYFNQPYINYNFKGFIGTVDIVTGYPNEYLDIKLDEICAEYFEDLKQYETRLGDGTTVIPEEQAKSILNIYMSH